MSQFSHTYEIHVPCPKSSEEAILGDIVETPLPARNMDYSKLFRMVRILGLMSVISYMIVILFTWVYANLTGYVYFSAGEPELLIKYPEWALGLTGIFVAIDCLRKELDALCELRVFPKKI